MTEFQFKLEALRQRYKDRSKYENQIQGLNLQLEEQAKVLKYIEEKLEHQTELTNRLKDGKAAQEKHWRERYENLKCFTDKLVNVCVDEKISIAHVVSQS